jgi:hypothetical protein
MNEIKSMTSPEWLPIETAPKDGTSILAYVKTSPKPRHGRCQIVYWNGQWVDTGGPIWAGVVTHWMPLPSHP